jgi:hypothetical protein
MTYIVYLFNGYLSTDAQLLLFNINVRCRVQTDGMEVAVAPRVVKGRRVAYARA